MVNGRSTDGDLLRSRMDQLNPASCCSVIYTTDVSISHGKIL